MGYFSNLDIDNKEDQGRDYYDNRYQRPSHGWNYGPRETRPYKVVVTPFGVQDFPDEAEARQWAKIRIEKGLSQSYKIFHNRKEIG